MSHLRIAIPVILGVLVVGVLLGLRGFPPAVGPGYMVVGYWGGTGDGPGRFDGLIGIDVSGDEVIVSDSRNGRIQVFDLDRSLLRQFPVPGARPGLRGRSMHIDVRDDKLYVPDYLADRVLIMSLHGKLLDRIGRTGSGPGEFDAPSAVAVDDAGFLWVADFTTSGHKSSYPTANRYSSSALPARRAWRPAVSTTRPTWPSSGTATW